MTNYGSDRNSRRTVGVLLGAVLLTMVAIAGQTWWAIDQDRKLTLASEKDHALITVRLLDEHASLTLREAERNLDAVVKAAHAAAKGRPLDDNGIRYILSRAQPFNKVLKSLQFVNPKGVASVSSIDYPAYQTDADDRTYIPYLLQHPDQVEQVIGKPFQRFYDGELVVPLARNIRGPDGRYLGIISTDISVSYFSGVYARVAKENNALVSLFSDDGQVIVRSPFDVSYLGLDISKSPAFERLRIATPGTVHSGDAGEASFEDDHFLDDKEAVPRLYVSRKIDGFPVTTIFAREVGAVLAPWRARTQDRLMFSGLTVGFIALLSLVLMQHIRRLHLSRSSLRTSETLLRQSESKFASLFQYSPVPLVLIRLEDDQFVEINESWSAQLGYRPDEVIGSSPHLLKIWVHPEARLPFLTALRRDGKVDHIEVQFRHKDGHVLTCLLSARVLDFSGTPMALFSPIDISHQRQVEFEIRELNAQLEERVRQRTHNLALTNQELADTLATLQTMQSEMLRSEKMAALGSLVAGVAHELNTPIGIGVTISSTLQDQTLSLLEELLGGRPRRHFMETTLKRCADAAGVLLRTLERAAGLISSFKQVAVDQSSENRRTFDLKTMLNELVVTLEPLHRATPFRLECDLEPGIAMESYPGALGQIVTNLVSNSIAHAFEGRSHGLMRLQTRRMEGGGVEIEFQDDGQGIPVDHRGLVFDPFFTTKLGRGGSGLGLHIVYNLVNQVLGGSVNLDKAAGSGALFRIRLPLCAPVHE